MSTTHPINRTTEWDVLQIKYGNYAPDEPEVKQEVLSAQAQECLASVDALAGKTLRELDELEDSGAAEEDLVEAYRRKRLEELKKLKAEARFSGVYLVSMDNYVHEVTLASANDTTVILHLYDDSVPACDFINAAFEGLSLKHRAVKFCKGKASSVLQKFNTKNLPTIVVYKNKICVHQIMGISAFTDSAAGLTEEVVEYVLAKKFKLFETNLSVDPRGQKSHLAKYLRGADSDDNDDSGDEDRISADALHTAAGDKGYSNMDLDRLMQLVRK